MPVFAMRLSPPLALISVLFSGAIFGFFYAWVCSTMWGLDKADPRVAIAAMQAMNASVRNMTFGPIFFGTPLILALTAAIVWPISPKATAAFAAASLLYVTLAFGLTLSINVPMNQALASQSIPDQVDAAREIWVAYSPRWQVFNLIRTVASGVTLALATFGLWTLAKRMGLKNEPI